MIELTEFQKEVIKTIKHHYPNKIKRSWFLTLRKDYEDIYGYKFNTKQSKYVMYESLLDLWLLIKDDKSGSERQLKSIIYSAMFTSIPRSQRYALDRVISELCGLIQINIVQGRYNLDVVTVDKVLDK